MLKNIFCIYIQQVASILKTILRDEITAIFRKQVMITKLLDTNEDLSQDRSFSEVDHELVIRSVTKAVDSIQSRLKELMLFDQDEETKISQLVATARNPKYLSHMDPAYHPWF